MLVKYKCQTNKLSKKINNTKLLINNINNYQIFINHIYLPLIDIKYKHNNKIMIILIKLIS